ncbi:hypothetical protein M0802_015986 [Mischocyttarus mexicanus]|nr:hypothetical protein M0802_015986 [Mischocyttarus mexicanus]
MGSKISKEKTTCTGIEGGGTSRSRGAGCRCTLFSSRFPPPGLRDQYRDGSSLGISTRWRITNDIG